MPYTNFIAAIDLGTSHLIGVVGIKNPGGTLSIIAHAEERSETSIRRGCVYNVEETANKVRRLLAKLENKLDGARIGKVYVGVGGMSLRSMDHVIARELGENGIVSTETIEALYDESCRYRPDMLDVLAVVSPTYYIDNQLDPSPVGVHGNRIEAHYKLIVARPSLRNYIMNSIGERANVEIAGVLVSPLAMSDVVLSKNEQNLGCALIGFGAGVTTLTVYKGGNLQALSVIPLGSHLITRDIMSLHVVEDEAERIKCAYGSALPEKDIEKKIQVSSADGQGMRDILLADLNNIVEARTREIIENVYARLEETGFKDKLGAGIVITGGGSNLRNLTEAVKERFKEDVRCVSVRKGIVSSGDLNPADSTYAVAVGLLMQGSANCALPIPEKQPTQQVQQGLFEEDEIEVVEPVKEPAKVKQKKSTNKEKAGLGFFDKFKNGVDNFANEIFKNQD
jgi:cell division protein FtsA